MAGSRWEGFGAQRGRPLVHRLSSLLLACFGLILLSSITAAANEFGPLKGNIFGSGSKALVVVLHGNTSRGGPAKSQDGVARLIADQFPQVTAVGVVRPGYTNGTGQKSPGDILGRSDNWTRKNNDLLAETILSLQAMLKPVRTIIVGHSGGAAQAAAVIGRYPGIAEVAILAGCPCDMRQYGIAYGSPNWRYRSESGSDLVSGIERTKVIALTGDRDEDVPPRIAQTYIEAARAAGVDARFVLVPGANHHVRKLMRPVMQVLRKSM